MILILAQSVSAAKGTTSNGKIILRYLTIAPRLFTLNPIVSNIEMEKKIQNQNKGLEPSRFFLKNKKMANKNNKTNTSIDAARERICFTSVG